MSRYSDDIRDELGRAIPGVLVYVYEWDVPSQTTGALSALTDDDLTTALHNPLTSDEFGEFYFNSSDGVKLLEYHYGGKLQYRAQIILTPAGFYPGNDATIRADLAASGGGDLVSFVQSGAGASSRTVQAKLRETVSVGDFTGADATGATDSYAAFLAARNAIPSTGGTIKVPSGTWSLSADPNAGHTKSIIWDISPDAVFTGAGTGEGKFPYANTNVASLPVGPYILSQSSQHSTNSNGAVNALTVEMLQPSSYGAGGSVGIYAAAKSAVANASAFVWAMNPLVRMEAGALGGGYGIEVDVDNYSASASAVGVLVSGTGDHNPLAAIITDRLAGKWQTGVNVRAALDGVVVFGETGGRGVVVDAPDSVLVSPYNATFAGRQFANNLDTLFLQRFTDTTPTGYFVRFRNAADSADLFSVGVSGDIVCGNIALASGAVLKVAGTQVVAARQTGWAADTGTAKKTANATYAAGTTLTYSATYVQAEQTAMATRMAAVEAALQNLSQTQKAIKDALIAHGLIGT